MENKDNRRDHKLNYEIQKKVPIPPRGRPLKYNLPLDKMKVDDHIKINVPKEKIRKEAKLIRNTVLRFKYKNPKMDFTVRALGDGIGIWRINHG
jgi:hypothetical protein